MKVDFAKLDRAFNPKCVVVVGDKAESNYMWLRGLVDSFTGKLYSVQIDPKEIEGIKALGVENFTSLMDVPCEVDFAVVAVPRQAAARVLADLIRKNVAAAHFFTAGFSETDTEEGRQLERTLTQMAEAANFHIVGPNCMGIFSPLAGVRQNRGLYTGIAGPVGFISQSGNHAMNFAPEAHLQGVDVNKLVSFGNGIVLDSTDYLEYFGQDPGIKAIGMYLEGVKDGRRFFRVLKDVAARKPVVIWKGGRTGEGVRAINSHTGSLAIPQATWDAAVRQCRAVKVGRMEDMIDTLKALLFLPPVKGDTVAAVGGSGGQSVAIADALAEAGLKLPPLSDASNADFAAWFNLVGGGYKNPVDTLNTNRRQMRRILEILERDTNTDNIVLLFTVHAGAGGMSEAALAPMLEMRQRTDKPVLAVIGHQHTPEEVQAAIELMGRLQSAGIPAFLGMERGAFALRNALEYYRVKAG